MELRGRLGEGIHQDYVCRVVRAHAQGGHCLDAVLSMGLKAGSRALSVSTLNPESAARLVG